MGFCVCFAQSPLGFGASLLLMPQRHFISFARTKETKQRKFAVCTFLPTPALFSAKQKELASLKQLFVFNAPKSTSASRQKSEAGPLSFLRNIADARWCGCFFCFACWCGCFLFYLVFSNLSFRTERLYSLSSRAERSVAKDLGNTKQWICGYGWGTKKLW